MSMDFRESGPLMTIETAALKPSMPGAVPRGPLHAVHLGPANFDPRTRQGNPETLIVPKRLTSADAEFATSESAIHAVGEASHDYSSPAAATAGRPANSRQDASTSNLPE